MKGVETVLKSTKGLGRVDNIMDICAKSELGMLSSILTQFCFVHFGLCSWKRHESIFPQLWVTYWTILPWAGKQSRKRKTLNSKPAWRVMSSVRLSCPRYTSAVIAAVNVVPLQLWWVTEHTNTHWGLNSWRILKKLTHQKKKMKDKDLENYLTVPKTLIGFLVKILTRL